MALFASLLLFLGATPAAAADGLTIRSDATYRVNADEGHLDVNNHLTLTVSEHRSGVMSSTIAGWTS